MGIVKENTGCGQAVQIRGPGLGMSAQATESVVQIVDDNEQNVSLVDRAVSKGWIVRR